MIMSCMEISNTTWWAEFSSSIVTERKCFPAVTAANNADDDLSVIFVAVNERLRPAALLLAVPDDAVSVARLFHWIFISGIQPGCVLSRESPATPSIFMNSWSAKAGPEARRFAPSRIAQPRQMTRKQSFATPVMRYPPRQATKPDHEIAPHPR